MNPRSPENRGGIVSRRRVLAMGGVLAGALLLRQVPVAKAFEEFEAAKSPKPTIIRLSQGIAAGSDNPTNVHQNYFEMSPEWGMVQEVVDKSAQLAEDQPEVGAYSLTLNYNGEPLSLNYNPGSTRAARLYTASNALAEGRVTGEMLMHFNGASEAIGISLQSDLEKLVMRHSFYPNGSQWLEKHQMFEIYGFDPSAPSSITTVYDETGIMSRLIIANGENSYVDQPARHRNKTA